MKPVRLKPVRNVNQVEMAIRLYTIFHGIRGAVRATAGYLSLDEQEQEKWLRLASHVCKVINQVRDPDFDKLSRMRQRTFYGSPFVKDALAHELSPPEPDQTKVSPPIGDPPD